MNNLHNNRYPSKRIPRLLVAGAAVASLASCNADTINKDATDRTTATFLAPEILPQTSTTLELNVNNVIKARAQHQAEDVAAFIDALKVSGGPNLSAGSNENQDGVTKSATKYIKNADGSVERLYANVLFAPVEGSDSKPKVMSVFIAEDNITFPPAAVGDPSSVIGYDNSYSLIRMQNASGDDWRLVTRVPASNNALFSTTEPLRGAVNPNLIPLTAEFLGDQVMKMSTLLSSLQQNPGIQPNN